MNYSIVWHNAAESITLLSWMFANGFLLSSVCFSLRNRSLLISGDLKSKNFSYSLNIEALCTIKVPKPSATGSLVLVRFGFLLSQSVREGLVADAPTVLAVLRAAVASFSRW